MKRFTKAAVGIAACLAAGAVAYATVTIDADGYGFVGKGDVQVALNWNNADLQTNAASLKFQFAASGNSTWECEKIVETRKETKVLTQDRNTTTSISSSVAYDARKNKQGQITGFNLNGFLVEEEVSTGPKLKSCPDDNSGWYYVEGSLQETVTDAGTLQVSADGTNWIPLTITQ